MPVSLPESLAYMEPFVAFLASLPAHELNEDVDPQQLDAALRRRFCAGDAETLLEQDCEMLESWLDALGKTPHPAHWILGYISGLVPEDFNDAFGD